MTRKIYHVVATDKMQGIGKDNKLPWHIPSELALFAKLTKGKTLVMGRVTFESLPKSFKAKDRTILVLGNGTTVEDILNSTTEDLYICGGAKTYQAFEPDFIYLTVIDDVYDCDTYYLFTLPGETIEEVVQTAEYTTVLIKAGDLHV